MKRVVLWILIAVILVCCAGCTSGDHDIEEPEDDTAMLIAELILPEVSRPLDLLQTAQEEAIAETAALFPLGNAGELEGRIVVFTIFASGADYSWDFTKQEDIDQKNRCLKDLSEALSYLADQAAQYEKDVEFLYDWEADPGLAAEYSAKHPMANTAASRDIAYGLASARQLKETYDADGIIYLFLVNTDYENTKKSHANYFKPEKDDGNAAFADLIEYVKINLRYSYEDERRDAQASTYAHELLHLFGVPDLYEAGTLITQEYADHMDAVMSTAYYPDIMYGSVAGWSVRNHVFSGVDAYYAGLTDECEDVEQYGLGKSQHIETDQD